MAIRQRDIAQGTRCKKVINFELTLGETMRVGILQKCTYRRAIGFDAIGVPVLADAGLLSRDHRL